MKGEINYAVAVYFLADVAWVYLSFQTGDVIGATFVVIGMTFGLIAFIKMNTGKMRKNLHLDANEKD